MRQSLTGIYLHHFSYSDSSVILKIFTREYGLKSFMLKGLKKKKGGAAVLQPFHLLELTGNYNPHKELNYANSVRLQQSSHSITMDIRKSTIAIFLTEILYKCIREEEANEVLYNFLEKSIKRLDADEFHPDFHLLFLMELTKHLGFNPLLPDLPSNKYFNIKEGIFEHPKVLTSDNLNASVSGDMKALIAYNSTGEKLNLTKERRSELLDAMVKYFEIHMHLKANSIGAHKILQAVFSN